MSVSLFYLAKREIGIQTDCLEERRRIKLGDGFVRHTHDAVHGIIFPLCRKRVGYAKGLLLRDHIANGDGVLVDMARGLGAVAVLDFEVLALLEERGGAFGVVVAIVRCASGIGAVLGWHPQVGRARVAVSTSMLASRLNPHRATVQNLQID